MNAAAARYARIAASYSNNPDAMRSFIREERETLRDLIGYAFFNAQIEAFRDFTKTHGAVWESLA